MDARERSNARQSGALLALQDVNGSGGVGWKGRGEEALVVVEDKGDTETDRARLVVDAYLGMYRCAYRRTAFDGRCNAIRSDAELTGKRRATQWRIVGVAGSGWHYLGWWNLQQQEVRRVEGRGGTEADRARLIVGVYLGTHRDAELTRNSGVGGGGWKGRGEDASVVGGWHHGARWNVQWQDVRRVKDRGGTEADRVRLVIGFDEGCNLSGYNGGCAECCAARDKVVGSTYRQPHRNPSLPRRQDDMRFTRGNGLAYNSDC
ncbi:hypothetical protein EBH_0082970 [Eimeria brunetti]|uniref:Uncharacterized protein n=1 Tax=Eimeria brunetti TaxID=51314 RepID=U6LY09_9EIME|nr:hypothetical protein EBH_0082970 [Eimeria brunetti]